MALVSCWPWCPTQEDSGVASPRVYSGGLCSRSCLLRRASAIVHHHTPKMVLRSAIFSTPEKNHTQLDTKYTPTAHLNNILKSAVCSTAGIFKRQGLL